MEARGRLQRLASKLEPRGEEVIGLTEQRVLKAVKKVVRPLARFGVARFFTWDVEQGAAEDTGPRELTVAEVAPGMLAEVAIAAQKPPGEFFRRVRLGDRCFAVFDRGAPVHMRWLARRPVEVPELGLYVCPEEDEGYLYDAYTIPEYRGRRAASRSRRLLCRTMLDAGLRRGYAYVLADNRSCLRTLPGIQKLLFQLRYLHLRGAAPLVLGTPAHPVYALEDIPAPRLAAKPQSGVAQAAGSGDTRAASA
ncbi:MAG: hypothetical protein HYZ28_12980 [Myxococcales bacterium]|nr:hypothetical protein [Myxococcales bacterium]